VAEAKGEAFLDRLGPMFIGTIHMIRATVADARATTPGNLLAHRGQTADNRVLDSHTSGV
jgi:hypothetical protein